jgi:hypothetical protein
MMPGIEWQSIDKGGNKIGKNGLFLFQEND